MFSCVCKPPPSPPEPRPLRRKRSSEFSIGRKDPRSKSQRDLWEEVSVDQPTGDSAYDFDEDTDDEKFYEEDVSQKAGGLRPRGGDASRCTVFSLSKTNLDETYPEDACDVQDRHRRGSLPPMPLMPWQEELLKMQTGIPREKGSMFGRRKSSSIFERRRSSGIDFNSNGRQSPGSGLRSPNSILEFLSTSVAEPEEIPGPQNVGLMENILEPLGNLGLGLVGSSPVDASLEEPAEPACFADDDYVEPTKCKICGDRSVVKEYHLICDRCAKDHEKCPKCLSAPHEHVSYEKFFESTFKLVEETPCERRPIAPSVEKITTPTHRNGSPPLRDAEDPEWTREIEVWLENAAPTHIGAERSSPGAHMRYAVPAPEPRPLRRLGGPKKSTVTFE